MTAMDFQPQRQHRRRGRRRRYLRRALRVLGPILLLLATVLLSLGIIHVIERDVVISDQESDARDFFSEGAQRREWQRRYDDLLREYYGENDASAGGIGEMEQGDARSEGLSLEEKAMETEDWMPEFEPFQLRPHSPDLEGDFDALAPELQFSGDLVPPGDLR